MEYYERNEHLILKIEQILERLPEFFGRNIQSIELEEWDLSIKTKECDFKFKLPLEIVSLPINDLDKYVFNLKFEMTIK